jgi:hypothetical protein
MIMQWYEDHPIDGNEIARSISVGLPPDEAPATNEVNNGETN